MAVGARSPVAPPGSTPSADPTPSDRELLDAVRGGDLHAYGALYERHVDAVRRLARRLCNNRSDVDDVVAEVFANSLRAIKAGRGPSDELRSYVLTSVRHTAAKLHTRSDSGRATPTENDDLDGACDDDPYHVADPISHAFVQLPDRFQNVLWLTAVEGMAPHEVGERTRMKAGAVTSLCLRARRALAREYLLSRVQRPIVDHDCLPVRALMPSVLHGDAAESSVLRVERHTDACDECQQCFDEMRTFADNLRSLPWPAAIVAWVKTALLRGVAPLADSSRAVMVGTAVLGTVAAMSVTTGDGPSHATQRVDAEIAASLSVGSTDAPPKAGTTPDDDVATDRPPKPRGRVEDAGTPHNAAPVTDTRAPDVTRLPDVIDRGMDTIAAGVTPAVVTDIVVTDIVVTDIVVTDIVVTDVEPITDPVVDTVATGVLDPIVTAVEPVTTPVVAPLVDRVVEPVLDDIVPVQQSLQPITDPAAGALAPVVDPLLDDVVAPLTEPLLDPLRPIVQPVTDSLLG